MVKAEAVFYVSIDLKGRKILTLLKTVKIFFALHRTLPIAKELIEILEKKEF